MININEFTTPVLSCVEGIEQMEQFLTGSQAVAFLAANSKNECYLDHPDEYLENDRIIIRRNHSTGLLIKP